MCSNATVADIPYSDPPNNNNISNIVNNINNIVSSNNKSVHVETLVEVAEDEHNEDDNKSKHNNREKKNQPINNKMSGRRKSKQEITPPRPCSQKEEKNNINYVTKQSLAKNVGEKISVKNTTAEVAVQVDQIELTTTKENHDAFALYHSCGFTIGSDVKNTAGDGRIVIETSMYYPLTSRRPNAESYHHEPPRELMT